MWIAAKIYVSQFDGWGAWAAAPILLVPLVASLVLGLHAAGTLLKLPPEQRWSWKAIGFFVRPWTPILNVLVDKLIRALTNPTGL